MNDIFQNIIYFCVILNTVTLSMEGLYSDDQIDYLRVELNRYFTIIFMIEFVMKTFGMGVKSNFLSN